MRKICVVTGTRADYGLLFWLMKEIQADPELELQVVATGMHLSPEFGLTYKIIEKDGFRINEKVEMLLSSDTPAAVAKSIGLGTIGFADVYDRLKPDIIVLLGDRFEILAAAQAAVPARIPIAHIHGGETTEGAMDESFRHAITKMAHVHFVTAKPYWHRVVQMGENPETVFNFGAPGMDNINGLLLPDREQFERETGFQMGKLNFLVTYHPVTLDKASPESAVRHLFAALDEFPDAKVIITKPNADTDGRIISTMIDEYCGNNPGRAVGFVSMGQARYLAAMKHSDVVVGNSSSGIIEAPAFFKPTVNIGARQRGRLRASSVIDCMGEKDDIVAALRKALSRDFQKALPETVNPYGKPGASAAMKAKLKNIRLDGILMKKFFDCSLPFGEERTAEGRVS